MKQSPSQDLAPPFQYSVLCYQASVATSSFSLPHFYLLSEQFYSAVIPYAIGSSPCWGWLRDSAHHESVYMAVVKASRRQLTPWLFVRQTERKRKFASMKDSVYYDIYMFRIRGMSFGAAHLWSSYDLPHLLQ